MKNLIYILFFFPVFVFSQDWYQEQHTYEYDDLNRLVKVVFHSGIVYEYQYDDLGNRLGKTIDIELDEFDFDVIMVGIQECTLGKVSVGFDRRNNYHLVFIWSTLEMGRFNIII